MNKAIPEGGRSVKCARCGHQWRLLAENAIEDDEAHAEAEQPQAPAEEPSDPFDRAADYMRRARGASAVSEADMEQQASDWLARRDHHASAISTLSQPELTGYQQAVEPQHEEEEPVEAAPETDAAAEDAEDPAAAEPSKGESWWQRLRAGAKSEEADEDEADEDVEGYEEPARNAGSFMQAEEPEPALDPVIPAFAAAAARPEEPNEASWPEFTAKSWREASAAEAEAPEPDFDQAEAQIREALRSALENPVEQPEPEFPKPEAVDWRSRWNLGSAEAKADAEPDVPAPPQHERFPFASHAADTPAADEEDDDEPFKLTGARAKFPVFGSNWDREPDESGQGHETGAGDHAFEHDIEDAFRSAGLPKRPLSADSEPFGEHEPAADFGSVFDERFARIGDDGPIGDGFDEDAAELQARLESTDLAAYERNRSYGGLAIAAAWAVFFSIVSGIALAFVSFRQDIMAALPGTRSLYHNLGFAIAENAVDFSDVSYRWTTVEGKPMIEVTGQVVNVTERTVKVPRVLINVRDGARRDPVKATASVQAELLAPRESTNFTLEFVSPSKEVSQIELEFDQSQPR